MLYGDCHAITGFGAPKRMVNITTWTFSWQAPAAGAGPITLYWGVVDGDCVMDSFGDDVKTGTLKLTEGMAQLERRSPPYALALILVPIVLAVSRGRRRS
jgi:hypothetical protein